LFGSPALWQTVRGGGEGVGRIVIVSMERFAVSEKEEEEEEEDCDRNP
jgi:hypothetical protein